jgi:hypothetical protein
VEGNRSRQKDDIKMDLKETGWAIWTEFINLSRQG